MPTVIDLRSDTVTRPTPAMWEVMLRAPVGDDVLGDDQCDRSAAALLGKEGCGFVPEDGQPGGDPRSHRAGDEVIAHEESHIILYEGGAPAVISGCMVRGLRGARGQFTAADVEGAVRPDIAHFPRSRLLVVENTQNRGGGSVWPLADLAAVAAAARRHGVLAHMDGARLWNAGVAAGVPVREIVTHLTVCRAASARGWEHRWGCGRGIAGVHREGARVRKMGGGCAELAARGCGEFCSITTWRLGRTTRTPGFSGT
jgi:threonine aldolase